MQSQFWREKRSMFAEAVVKVGGSLFDLPHLGSQLHAWIATLPTRKVLLIPGGGSAADLVRQVDRLDQLGDEQSHWLALRAMAFTAHVLATRLGDADVIADADQRHDVWQSGHIPVLDAHAFAFGDEQRPDHLPHHWEITSDSLAARVAHVATIPLLYLMKSRNVPPDWATAARQGVVDAAFPALLASYGLHAAGINFRNWVSEHACH
jgi:5-(aminomethyl)-3-furanmethanol phosphate kinase